MMKITNLAQPVTIAAQGSFFSGGSVIKTEGEYELHSKDNPIGQTLHGDHAYVFYQIPEKAKKYPIVFLHGHGQSGKTWETTPDGREGFQTIFLRKGYGVCVLDQPRRGRASLGTEGTNINASPNDIYAVNSLFRLGIWPDYFDTLQFDKSQETYDQFCRWQAPNTGPFDMTVVSDGVAAALTDIGDNIFVTHSMGGGVGWMAASKSKNCKGIISYEPGSNFVFPEGEVPEPLPSSHEPLKGVGIPMERYEALTKMPIVIYYGDNIPESWCEYPGIDAWRVRLDMAYIFAETINRHGGDCQVVYLPKDQGIKGNTHFPFADLNNSAIADLMEGFLKEKKLDIV